MPKKYNTRSSTSKTKKDSRNNKRDASSSSNNSDHEEKQTLIDKELEIAKTVYSNSDTEKQEKVDNKHMEDKARSLKRNRTSGVEDKDSHMFDNTNEDKQISSPSNNKHQDTTEDNSLNGSIHKPNSTLSEKQLGKLPVTPENGSRDSGKKKDDQVPQIDQNSDDLRFNSDNEFQDYTGAKSYDLFTVLTYDQSKNKDHVKENLKKIFNNFDNFIGIRGIYATSHIHYAIIQLKDQIDQQALDDVSKSIGNYKPKFHIFTPENLDKHVNEALVERSKRTIKLVDLDSRLSYESIIQSMNKIGQIESLQEIKKSINNKSNINQPINKRKIFFKQMYVTFKSIQTVTKILNEPLYAIEIENTVARILPWDTTTQEFKNRTGYSFKITGLPVDVTPRDLTPLIRKLQGWSCTIMPKLVPQQRTKIAYTYVNKETYSDTIRKFEIFGTTVFAIPNHIKKRCCNICGDPRHILTNCPKHFNNSNDLKSSQKILIHSNNPYRPRYNIPTNEMNTKNNMDVNNNNAKLDAIEKFKAILSWSYNVNLETKRTKSISGKSNKSNNTRNNNQSRRPYINNSQPTNIKDNINKDLQIKIDKLEKEILILKKENQSLKDEIHGIRTNFIPETIKSAVRIELNEIANEFNQSNNVKPSDKQRSHSTSSIYSTTHRAHYVADADTEISSQNNTIITTEYINPNYSKNPPRSHIRNNEEVGSIIDGSLPPPTSSNNNKTQTSYLGRLNPFNYN